MQVTKFRGPLDIGGHVQIPVWSFPRTSEAKFPSLSKVTAEEKPIRMDRRHVDEDGNEVSGEDVEKAYNYGTSQCPVSLADLDSMKPVTTKCLRVIGFTRRDRIPRHFAIDGVDLIVPEPGNPVAATAISALVGALRETDRCIIARYVKRANSRPLLAMLTPYRMRPDEGAQAGAGEDEDATNFDALILNILPFLEDIRDFTFLPFDSEAKFEPSQEQLDAADALIDAFDLTRPEAAETAAGIAAGAGARGPAVEHGEGYRPTRTFHPSLQRFYQALQARALDPQAPLPPLHPTIRAYVETPTGLHEAATDACRRFRAAFPLREPEAAKARGTKRYWGDRVVEEEQRVEEEQAVAAASGEPAAKKPRADGDEESGFQVRREEMRQSVKGEGGMCDCPPLLLMSLSRRLCWAAWGAVHRTKWAASIRCETGRALSSRARRSAL